MHRWLLSIIAIAALLSGVPAALAQDAAKNDPSEIEIAYVLHVLNELVAVIGEGGEAAGRDLGITVTVVGPAAPNSDEQIPLFEAAVQKGVDGIVVIPQPGDVWVTPIQAAVDAGIPVVNTSVTSPDSASPLYVGMDEYASGVILGGEIKTFLEADGTTEGLIVVGSCIPSVAVQYDRYDGIIEGLKGTNYTISELYDVTGEDVTNYAAWENLAAAYPEMVMAVGLCSADIPNLALIKERTGAKWQIAGYNLNLPALEAIQSGVAQVTIGQQPFLQGYLAVLAVSEHLINGTPLTEGWLQAPPEVVTAENVDAIYERENDPEVEAAYYRDYVAEHFSDLNAEAAKHPYPGRETAATPTP